MSLPSQQALLQRLVLFLAIFFFPASILEAASTKEENRPLQYILLNRRPGWGWSKGEPEVISREAFTAVRRALPETNGSNVRIGMGFVFSYFRGSDEMVSDALRNVLKLAQETDTPVYLQLDGEQWWEARPDLWNWWDPSHPGFDPKNRENVEWSGWSSKDALKIAWRNWGQQIRVRPPPNLMSPRYREACHEKMNLLIPIILNWWKALPSEKKDLFVGIKVGWESSIGVNSWYYPKGNALLDKPRERDPKKGLDGSNTPSRGAAQIGYAAVKTAGIRTKGKITEADLAEVVRRHLEDLCRTAATLGVPREKLFTHGVGWKENELNYQAAVNEYSCPAWSFYKHAADPSKDVGVQNALKKSNAPYWAATEWLFQGPRETERWKQALENTLADRRCRFVCIYNWESIDDNEPALQAIRELVD
ncbi:MAG: hypothetical protein JWM68_2499 [Verrucomicrobiales bacterium]|nr:hypothetical protein [Verrucomicrobiales bacterium]